MATRHGTEHADNLKGLSGSDTILGRGGADVIIGNAEANREMLVGGSFESAKIGDGRWGTVKTVGGWQTDTSIEIWGKDFLGVKATDGTKIVELDSDKGFSRFWQDVQTEPGQSYDFSFDFAKRAGTSDATNGIEVYWNNQLVGTYEPNSTVWSTGQLSLVGTGGSDRLEFREQVGFSDSLGGLIDNVSLKIAASGEDVLIGGRGHDTIDGLSGDDTIYGGGMPGNGLASADAGLEDNDTIYAGAGNDRVFGGHGNDTIYGEDGRDTISGGRGDDVIDGGAGDDTLKGNSGNDTIRDGSGNDTAHGGSGNDTFIAGSGNDSYFGGAGFDVLTYVDARSGVKVDLSKHTITGFGTDRVHGIEAVEGSSFDDRMKGSKHDDTLIGGAGNDNLRGLGGSDTLTGGEGADTFVWKMSDINQQVQSGAVDRITDFSSDDRIDLSELTAGMSLDEVFETLAITTDGENTHLYANLGGGSHELAVLEGYQAADLQAMIQAGHILI